MFLKDALTEFAYARDLTPASRRWYDQKLTAFIAWLQEQGVTEVEGITAPLARRFLDSRRATGMSSQTLHGYARGVRAWLFWLASEDLLDEKVPRRIALPKKDKKVLRVLDDSQIARLFSEAKRTPTPLRDTALLSLLIDTGARASELCGLTLDAVNFGTDSAWILVKGKGRREREIGLGRKSRQALHKYIHRERHHAFMPLATEQHVFLGTRGPLTPEGLDRLLYRLRDRAGAEHFEGVSLGAHRFRHLHAVRAIEAGADIFTVSRSLGHSEIQTTTHYLSAVSQRKLRQLAISPLDTLGK